MSKLPHWTRSGVYVLEGIFRYSVACVAGVDVAGRVFAIARCCGPACAICMRTLQHAAVHSRELEEYSMTGDLAAIDMQNFACHERRRIQIQDRFDDVAHFAHAAHWMQRAEFRVQVRGKQRSLDHSR